MPAKKRKAKLRKRNQIRRASPDSLENLSISRKALDLLKFELLKRIDLFQPYSKNTLEAMSKDFQEIILSEDEVLFEDGEPEKTMYIILSGELLIYKLKKPIAVLGSGEYVGEMTLIESKARAASARAISDTLLLEVDEDQFKKYLLSEPAAVFSMMKTLSNRLRKDIDAMAGEMQKLNTFTHDMRNCLVPLGIVEVLLPQVLETLPKTKRKDADKIKEQVNRSFDTVMGVRNNLITMIDQSLAFAKKIKSEYVKEIGDLGQLIKETARETSFHKHILGNDLKIAIKGKIKPCRFNFLDIKRVLQNLIINAGYVSPKGEPIHIIIQDIGDTVQVSVKDNGTGIPDEIKPILLKENFTSKPDGNGFGLISCRDIIQDYHQGALWFESELGKGATFHFTLPYNLPRDD